MFSAKGSDWFRLKGLSHHSPHSALKTLSQAEGGEMDRQGFSQNSIHQSIILGLAQRLSFSDSVLDSESSLSNVIQKKKISRRHIIVAFWHLETDILGFPTECRQLLDNDDMDANSQ